MDPLEILVKDIEDLRLEMRTGFRDVNGRLETSLPSRFVGKGDFATLTRWVKWNFAAVGVIAALLIVTHESIIIAFFEWLRHKVGA